MKRLVYFSILFAIIFTSSTLAAESVTFVGLSPSYEKGKVMPTFDKELILKANLTKPEGNAPFPAVIMMHGCNGEVKYLDAWENRFGQWGYVVLRVDSMTPRKKQTLCHDDGMALFRAQDAYDAKSYLMELPYVNKEKIGLIGWSQGGMAALHALDDAMPIQNRGNPFQCAIAFYPYCSHINRLNAPFLILIGENDDWTPSSRCETLRTPKDSQFKITLKIYENAYHCFDWEGYDYVYQGHILKYNEQATKDAVSQVKSFLSKHLK